MTRPTWREVVRVDHEERDLYGRADDPSPSRSTVALLLLTVLGPPALALLVLAMLWWGVR